MPVKNKIAKYANALFDITHEQDKLAITSNCGTYDAAEKT
jgi:hypothetical protein